MIATVMSRNNNLPGIAMYGIASGLKNPGVDSATLVSYSTRFFC
jgi:hypothetical protein